MQTRNIGTAMIENRLAAFKWIAAVGIVVAYLGVVLYCEVRTYTLLARTIEAGLLPLALVGVFCQGILAVSLPLLIHHGSEPGPHRLWAMLLYAADILVMGFNAVLDASLHTGAEVTAPLQMWAQFGVPAVPVALLAGVAVLWLVDPAQRDRDLTASVRAATRFALAQQVIDAASGTEVNEDVQAYARAFARQLVAETLGQATAHKALRAPDKAVVIVPSTASARTRKTTSKTVRAEKPADAPGAVPETGKPELSDDLRARALDLVRQGQRYGVVNEDDVSALVKYLGQPADVPAPVAQPRTKKAARPSKNGAKAGAPNA
jgi:hypothetical protein